MKKLLFAAFFAAIGCVALVGCNTQTQDAAGKPSDKPVKDAVSENPKAKSNALAILNVTGMTCESCQVEVARQIALVEGVASSSVNYKSGIAEVKYDRKTTTPDKIAAGVSGQYKATVRDMIKSALPAAGPPK